MRALIRDVKTGMFYGLHGQWTDEREDARDFENSFKAMAFAGEKQLCEAEVVMTFGSPEFDFTISVDRVHQPPRTFREGKDS
jgi:hypothetical protein